MGDVTLLLTRARAGDEAAANELFDAVYGELRSIAGRIFGSRQAGHTLQPTALVHEAYLKLAAADIPWQDRAHFRSVAAKAMRQILINHARDRAALKRGGGADRARVTMSGLPDARADACHDVLAVHDALEELARLSPRQAEIAELRFFAGLTNPEVAEILGLSLRAVELDWKMAKAQLAGKLGEG